MDSTETLFEKYVQNAIAKIPKEYAEKMDSVAILIEERPSDQQVKNLRLRSRDSLFGLYEGVPLPKRGGALLQIPPDRITIFKHPMMELYPNPKDLEKQVFETLWHEVAHFFGLNHQQIHLAKRDSKS
jgi:predicted Zn-dependent protease with MMP-like domain